MKKNASLRFSSNQTKLTWRWLSVTTVVLTVATLLAACALTAGSSYADTTVTRGQAVSVTVSNACTMTGGSDGTSTTDNVYGATVSPNTKTTINGSKFVTVCNDAAGYSVYAIGYSGNTYGNTGMVSTVGTIATNLNTSGSTSGWAMQVTQATPGAPTIMNSFDSSNFHVIPSSYAQIAKYTSPTASSSDTGAAIQTKYQVFVSSAQPAGTYTGKVKYTMVHPNNAAAPTTPITLNAIVASGTTHYMQESIDCAGSTVGTVATLTDNRDGKTYKVAKAADGNCWMIQNLQLGKTVTSSSTSLTLTPANSNINGNFTLNYSDQPSGGRFHAYTVDGVEYQNNSTEYYCTGGSGQFESCYYNWYTATAGAGTTSVTSGSVDTSICPSGWSLPTQPQFSTLYNNYNSPSLMAVDNPTTTYDNANGKIPGFLLSGLYYTGGAYYLGSLGYYWSRTAFSAQYAHYLGLLTSNVNPGNGGNKYGVFAVRCVLQ